MKIGFTGTQDGMTGDQKFVIAKVLVRLGPSEFHHGDCIGSDKQADEMIKKYFSATEVIIHPPSNPKKRAFCKGKILEEKDYLDRNKDIVDNCDVLIATPKGKETLRSGTWSTIRYANKIGKEIFIAYPDGKTEIKNISLEQI